MVNLKDKQVPGTSLPFFYGYIVVAAGFMIMITMFSTRYAFGVFFKPVQAEFGWTRAATSGAFSLSMFTEGLVGIVMGGLNDRLGPRKVLTCCGLLLGIGCFLMSYIQSLWQLYLFFGIILGMGMSGGWIPLTSTVVRWFIKRRGIMSGIVLTGTGLAALIAPPMSNYLISTYGWRYSYTLIGIVALITIVSAAQLLRRDPHQMGQLPYGAGQVEINGAGSGQEGISLKNAASTGEFWLLIPMLFCFGFLMFTVMVHIVPHVTDLGFSSATAANTLAAIGGTAVLGRLFLGYLADRIGSHWIFIIGFIIMIAAFFWLSNSNDLWMFYVFSMSFGFAQGGMGSSESLLVADIFGVKSHGLIYGVVGAGFLLGSALGPWVAGYVYDVWHSYTPAFMTCGAMAIAGLVSMFILAQVRKKVDLNHMF